MSSPIDYSNSVFNDSSDESELSIGRTNRFKQAKQWGKEFQKFMSLRRKLNFYKDFKEKYSKEEYNYIKLKIKEELDKFDIDDLGFKRMQVRNDRELRDIYGKYYR